MEDFKPASSNQPGKQYPQVNSEGRARFRIVAPEAQSVRVPEWGGIALTKGEDGAWVGTTRPLDEGFHYYRSTSTAPTCPTPAASSSTAPAAGAARIEIPAKDADFYALKNVPHGQLRESPVLLQEHQHHPPLLRLHAARLRQGHRASAIRCCTCSTAAARTRPAGAARAARTDHGQPDRRGQGQAVHHRDGQRRRQLAGGPPTRRPPARGGAGAARGRPRFNFSAFAKILTEELIPFIDSNFRTLADQPHRAMAGLSMGGMQTRQITLANLDKFSHIGCSAAAASPRTTRTGRPGGVQAEGQAGVRQLRQQGERPPTAKANHEALEKLGIKSIYYESPDTAHEWQTWRRSLYQFAPLLFRD